MPEPRAENANAAPSADAKDRIVAPGSSPGSSRTPRVLDMLLNASGVGLVVSLLIHITLGVIAASIVVAPAGFGIGASSLGAGAGVREIAADTELTELSISELLAIDASIDEASFAHAAPQLDPMFGASAGAAFDADALGAMLSELEGLGGSGLAGSGEGDGSGAADGLTGGFGGAGDGGARFFGAEARGRRIAYVVDVSGSMASHGRLRALQDALIESINGLHSRASFCIVLFSTNAEPLGGSVRWTGASESNKRGFVRLIERIQARGQTIPQPAFDAVFSLRPRPDAVFFMTDGIFAEEAMHYINHLNRSSGTVTPIHCIAFASPGAERIMVPIAQESGGTFMHVAEPSQ
ncbi:MAG: hypothetical protein EA379_10400 [Phycisphaerales bacterium]|nr:MAG: hypothetical protein EA379_10400 [Phycisphaerales bacterium]